MLNAKLSQFPSCLQNYRSQALLHFACCILNYVGDDRLALGDRPGLVQHHCLNIGGALQALGVLDQDAMLCAGAGSDRLTYEVQVIPLIGKTTWSVITP
jgi:hypothetical protein